MKPLALAGALAAWLAIGTPARATDVDIGVSIGISQPGVYGRIDIGRFPQPQLIVPQPVLVAPAPALRAEPVYLWVPYEHRRNWRAHCGRYNACGVPVYFVRHDWYDHHVRAENRRESRDDRRDGRREDRREDGRGKRHGRDD